MNKVDGERIYDTTELMLMLGVDRKTVFNWFSSGLVTQPRKRSRGKYRVKDSDLCSFLAGRKGLKGVRLRERRRAYLSLPSDPNELLNVRKNPHSVMLSDEETRMLGDLSEKLGITRTDVFRKAITALYEDLVEKTDCVMDRKVTT